MNQEWIPTTFDVILTKIESRIAMYCSWTICWVYRCYGCNNPISLAVQVDRKAAATMVGVVRHIMGQESTRWGISSQRPWVEHIAGLEVWNHCAIGMMSAEKLYESLSSTVHLIQSNNG